MLVYNSLLSGYIGEKAFYYLVLVFTWALNLIMIAMTGGAP